MHHQHILKRFSGSTVSKTCWQVHNIDISFSKCSLHWPSVTTTSYHCVSLMVRAFFPSENLLFIENVAAFDKKIWCSGGSMQKIWILMKSWVACDFHIRLDHRAGISRFFALGLVTVFLVPYLYISEEGFLFLWKKSASVICSIRHIPAFTVQVWYGNLYLFLDCHLFYMMIGPIIA